MRAGSQGWQYSVVMGLLAAFGMDREGDGTALSNDAGNRAGGKDTKAHGRWMHLNAVPPAHGITGIRTRRASSKPSATLCWRIRSSYLVTGSLQVVAENYAERLFSDAAIRCFIAEGVQLAALLPTDRMQSKEMPPSSDTLVPAMALHSRLVRAHGVRAATCMTGGVNTQRNSTILMGVQVGVVELSQRLTLMDLTHVFACVCYVHVGASAL